MAFLNRLEPMKNSLKLSVTLNVLLVAATLWLSHGQRSSSEPSIDVREAADSSTGAAETESQSLSPVSYEPFRWNQIESTNYLIYISNLRRIGCPEQTIRDLISADVDTLYAPRRAQLERQSPAGSVGLMTGQHANAVALQKLRQEEGALIENLLHPGSKAPPWETIASQSASEIPVQSAEQEFDNVRVPAFMKPISDNLQLTTEQSQAIDEVKQWFVNQVGGANQDPSDPEYMRRWEKAQPQADGLLLGKLGLEAYLQYASAIHKNEASQHP